MFAEQLAGDRIVDHQHKFSRSLTAIFRVFDPSGSHIGDRCCTSDPRCKNGVTGGFQNGNSRSHPPMAGGIRSAADFVGDWSLAEYRARFRVLIAYG